MCIRCESPAPRVSAWDIVVTNTMWWKRLFGLCGHRQLVDSSVDFCSLLDRFCLLIGGKKNAARFQLLSNLFILSWWRYCYKGSGAFIQRWGDKQGLHEVITVLVCWFSFGVVNQWMCPTCKSLKCVSSVFLYENTLAAEGFTRFPDLTTPVLWFGHTKNKSEAAV